MTLSLGVELGATWLRLCLADEAGRVLKRARAPGRPWRESAPILEAQLRRWGRPELDRLVFGGKGLWRKKDQRALAARLRRLARRVRVLSDLELAHVGAFRGGPGVLLIAGSGSAALARDRRGRFRRAGGWGPLIGDEGSGFWIGKEALHDPRLSKLWPADMPLRVGRGDNPVRATAALARVVLARAAKGNAAAKRLRARAAKELLKLAVDASRDLPAPVELVLHGGLFDDLGLRTDFLRALPRRFVLRPPAMPAEVAAATLELVNNRA